MLRINQGLLKGKVIKFPKGKIRPTTNLVRNAIFNIIGFKVKGSSVLDLFCGSGALGITALSLGAKEVLFIEKNRKVFNYLLDNIKDLLNANETWNLNHYCGDVFRILPKLANKKFDIIFFDPPYASGYGEKTLRLITNLDLLADDGIVVGESSKRVSFALPETLKKIKEKIYGDTKITIIKKRSQNEKSSLSG